MRSDKSEADWRRDFATLWAESYDRVRTYVRIFVPSLHDSEDVIQETALAIAKDFDKYDPQRPFLEWAIGIARNRVHQHFRRRGRDKQMVFDLDTILAIEKGFLATESRFDDYRDALDDCLKRLPARSRRLIHARYLTGMNGNEIANQVGLTIQSVYTRLSQIRLGLRDCIQRRLRLHGDEA
jgi:RNA polymerase sigma-70 factor (ECF subfamily)